MGLYLLLGIGLILLWSIACVIWVNPTSIGISVGCLCEVLLALLMIFISGISPLQLAEALQLMNPEENVKTIKNS